MDIDADTLLHLIGEQAKAAALLASQLAWLQKHSDKQAAELAELRKAPE